MPRKPMADKGVQTSLRLSSDLYDRLTRAAGDKGIGEEIRQRLEASFTPGWADATDEPTHQFLDAIAFAARRIPDMTEKIWHTNPDMFRAFREALLLMLPGFEPAGEPKASEKDIETLGAMLAGLALSQVSAERARRAIRAEQRKEAGLPVPVIRRDRLAVQHITDERENVKRAEFRKEIEAVLSPAQRTHRKEEEENKP